MNNSDSFTSVEDEIDFKGLFTYLWKSKFIVAATSLIFALVGVFYSLSLDNIYRSEALLAPAESNQPNSPLLSQFGAAAGLIGFNLPDASGDVVATAIATLQSREFIRRFIDSHSLKPALLAGYYDGESGSLQIDSSIYDAEADTWVGEMPTDQDAFRVFHRILSISENRTNGLITVAIEWIDPTQARDWVAWLIEDINALIKQQDLSEANEALEYLRKQLESTQLVEMQRAFYQLIESQTRIVMLADVREDYVFKIIDPPVAPQERLSPNRTLISLVAFSLGAILSVIGLLLVRSTKL
ncbi:MAG: Wzz/FepE/Etk N-terminal domain-containing protein [Gammaproteobacteria bacterium]